MDAFSFPFRFKNGSPIYLDSETDEYAAQKILTVLQTRPNELPIHPDFGTTDPLFDQTDQAGLYSTIATFFPELSITGIQELLTDDGRVEVSVEFNRTTTRIASLS